MVVAVNAYDESRDMVASFVKVNHLDHPILLGGRLVAKEQYIVSAYPTSYLIGRDGRIVRRSVGFEPEEAPEIEEEIEALLDKPEVDIGMK